MADPFSCDAFYASAREFALSALEAHHSGNHRRVPIDAGTAVEHLAKACLARRSPALLVELRRDSSFDSLIALLRIEGAGGPGSIRTVGLSEALSRIGRFVKSKVSKGDLQTLIDLRNGIVHAAEDAEVEERILTAFVQQADSLLTDFGGGREDFWDGQLAVVNALSVFHPAISRAWRTWMALASCPACQGQQRSLRRISQVLSWALARSPGARSCAWAELAAFWEGGLFRPR